MSPTDLPVIGWLLASGPPGQVFDWLLLLGPVVILIVAVVGRTPVTASIASIYLAAFLSNVLSKAIQ